MKTGKAHADMCSTTFMASLPVKRKRIYAAPRGMVKNANQKLRELGWPEDLIHYEHNG
jgi:ferredoxin-NADP reductase